MKNCWVCGKPLPAVKKMVDENKVVQCYGVGPRHRACGPGSRNWGNVSSSAMSKRLREDRIKRADSGDDDRKAREALGKMGLEL